MSNSEVKVGSLIRVKVGRNLILARVLEVLNDGFRVCSVAKNKEFNVPQSRVELNAEDAEQPAATEQMPAPANTEPQAEAKQEPAEPEASAQTEQEGAEEQAESGEEAEASEQDASGASDSAESEQQSEPGTPATVDVIPEDETAEFTPSGEDQEDEYAINPAHESDKPRKRMSLLDAAVEVLKAAGPEHPMNCKEILEAILERQLWTPTEGKTPEQTLYGSLFREISTKEHPRIMKSDVKGKFRIAD